MVLFMFSVLLITSGIILIYLYPEESIGFILMIMSIPSFMFTSLVVDSSDVYTLKNDKYEIIGSNVNSMCVIYYDGETYEIKDHRSVMKLQDGDVKLKVDRSFYGTIVSREIIIK